jgi:hypothetical protein
MLPLIIGALEEQPAPEVAPEEAPINGMFADDTGPQATPS